jgi:hypothetical protein
MVTDANQLNSWLADRVYWQQIFGEVRQVLKTTEENVRQKLGVQSAGVWVDTFLSTEPTVTQETEEETTSRPVTIMDDALRRRYGLPPLNGGAAAAGGEGAEAGGAPKPKAAQNNTNELAFINLTIRAINLQQVKPQANNDLAYELERGIKASPLFDEKESQLSGTLEQVDDNAVTFTFPLKLKLRRPIKL